MHRTQVRPARRLGSVASVGVAAILALVVAAGRGAASEPASTAGSYVVRPGDTLWAIAARRVGPSGDPRPEVDRLVHANGIREGLISPGQRLIVP